MPNWTVDEALGEVLVAIEAGAGLTLGKDARKELDHYYRPSFKEMHQNNGDWYADRPRILLLAHVVGFVGGLLERVESFPSSPSEVSGHNAKKGAETASFSKACPDPPVLLGGWCPPKGSLSDASREVQALVAALEPIFRSRRGR